MTTPSPGTVVITGSNGGLGTRIVEGFLEAGIRDLACHYRSKADAVTGVLLRYGLDPARHLFQAELTAEGEVRDLARAVGRMGPVWGLLNLAGGSSNATSWMLSLDTFQRVLADNLLSTFLMTRAFIPGMLKRGEGRIINISSIVAHTGAAGASHYCAAKAAIEGFTRAVAQEVASRRITVNCLALGYFDEGIITQVPPDTLDVIKGRIPLKRLGRTFEIHPLLLYLLDPRSEFMTGQVLHLNGGQYT